MPKLSNFAETTPHIKTDGIIDPGRRPKKFVKSFIFLKVHVGQDCSERGKSTENYESMAFKKLHAEKQIEIKEKFPVTIAIIGNPIWSNCVKKISAVRPPDVSN